MTARVLPHDLAAERAVLGAILLSSGDAVPRVSALLSAADCYDPRNQAVLGAAYRLHHSGRPVDPITLADELGSEQAAKVGGMSALAALAEAAPTAEGCEHYARIVRDRAQLRALIRSATDIAAAAYEPQGTADEEVQHAISSLQTCFSRELGGRSVQDVVSGIIADVERHLDHLETSRTRGVPTGMRALDGLLTYHGLPTGLLTILAAEPGVGKSALAKDIAFHVAGQGEGVLVCTFEDRAESPVSRHLARRIGVPAEMVLRAEVEADGYNRMLAEASALHHARLHFFEQTPRSSRDLCGAIQRYVESKGASLVVVDYFQLIRYGERCWARQEETDRVLDDLVLLSRRLPETAMLVVSQFRRIYGARPTIGDLYHSGKLEQAAKLILLLSAPISDRFPALRVLDIAKQNEGRTDLITLGWHGPQMAFFDAEQRLSDEYLVEVKKHWGKHRAPRERS